MNKKVSTIFAMAALAGGAFCGSAYAQSGDAALSGSLLDKYESGSVMLANQATTPIYLGYIADPDGGASSDVYNQDGEDVLKKEILNNTWNVRVIAGDDTRKYPHYIFVNAVTGDTLSFKKDGSGALLIQNKKATPKKVWAADGAYTFTFEETAYAKDAKKLVTVAKDVLDTDGDGAADAAGYVNITAAGGATVVDAASAGIMNLYKLATANADVHDLNLLYNGKGFNLGVKPDLTSTDVVDGNLFDSAEQRIWVYEVTDADIKAGAPGYELPSQGTEKLYVPKGVYFFTNPVFKGGKGAADYNKQSSHSDFNANHIDWLNSTFVALSPTETLEATDVARGAGEGFKLITEKGTNFIFEDNTSDPAGEDLSIYNACFTVKTNFDATYPYAISLAKFYYQKTANFKGTDAQTEVAAYLGVSSYNNTEQSLVSMKGSADDAEYLFFLKASSVVDGKTLLHTSKKAAIYTMKFISGQSSDKDLINKYLTVGSDGSNWKWEAKGAAITDTDFPVFQFVITAVDKDNNVTFTNRETGFKFTTQLFPEEGTNRYSLATDDIELITPYTVNTTSANTYEVKALKDVPFDSDIVVELTRMDNVDQYAGFLNIDNESIRTLAFARDKNDTSNKLYSIVDNSYKNNSWYDKDGITQDLLELSYNTLTNTDNFVNEISDAAQWQLLKGSAATISRVYVYNNTATESVDDVPNGDKVSVYVYSLRYVADGTETPFFLSNDYISNSSQPYALLPIEDVEKASDVTNKTAKFYIKENVDGSVSLMPYKAFTSSSNKVAAASEAKALEVSIVNDEYTYVFTENVYASASYSNDIKTYLDPQPIEISWPANEGHVTLESELGNFITMDENRDAIVVNENDADDFYLYVTDKDAIVPSFYITKGVGATDGERMFLFNPTDSVDYYVADGDYDRKYQWAENTTKAMFKAAKINDTRDTLTVNVKGETKYIAKEADDNNADIWGGINRFKFQIIETADEDGHYYVRQTNSGNLGNYLSSLNEKVTWNTKDKAMIFTVESVAAPTANEGVSATEVKIIATDGAINVKNAAGKNVVVSTILGQIVANEVLTSDNATISVPAGIVIVSVDGEEAVKVNVK